MFKKRVRQITVESINREALKKATGNFTVLFVVMETISKGT